MTPLPSYGQPTEKLVLGYGLPRPLTALWREVDWKEHKSQAAAIDAEALTGPKPVIVLYPSMAGLPEQERHRAFLRVFGKLVFNRFDARQKRRWEHKFVLPEPGHIDNFQRGLHEGFDTFLKIVESSQDPVQRLISIHLANALIANNVDPGDAASDLDVRKWPATEEFANCQRFYSLEPLLGAYCPPPMIDHFGEAFADLLLDRMEKVYHTSVRGVFIALMLELLA